MSDLISRQAAINAIAKARDKQVLKHEYGWEWEYNGFNHAIQAIPLPTEPERKKGKWIQVTEYDIDNNAVFECSVCRGSDTHAKGVAVPYCWHCGARMQV